MQFVRVPGLEQLPGAGEATPAAPSCQYLSAQKLRAVLSVQTNAFSKKKKHNGLIRRHSHELSPCIHNLWIGFMKAGLSKCRNLTPLHILRSWMPRARCSPRIPPHRPHTSSETQLGPSNVGRWPPRWSQGPNILASHATQEHWHHRRRPTSTRAPNGELGPVPKLLAPCPRSQMAKLFEAQTPWHHRSKATS